MQTFPGGASMEEGTERTNVRAIAVVLVIIFLGGLFLGYYFWGYREQQHPRKRRCSIRLSAITPRSRRRTSSSLPRWEPWRTRSLPSRTACTPVETRVAISARSPLVLRRRRMRTKTLWHRRRVLLRENPVTAEGTDLVEELNT
jgi:hypothetical protein